MFYMTFIKLFFYLYFYVHFVWSKRCGKSDYIPVHKSGYIIGGVDVERPLSLPWMVLLKRNDNFHCGGSLISSKWVLTVAHCVELKGNYSVVLGEHDISIKEGDKISIKASKVRTI